MSALPLHPHHEAVRSWHVTTCTTLNTVRNCRKTRFERDDAINANQTLYTDYLASKLPARRVTSLKHLASAGTMAHDYSSTLHPHAQRQPHDARLGDALCPPPPPSFAADAHHSVMLPLTTDRGGSCDSLRCSTSPSTVTSFGREGHEHIYEVPRFCGGGADREPSIVFAKNH